MMSQEKKGYIKLSGAVIISIIGLAGSIYSSKIAASGEIKDEINTVNTKISVVEEREQNHYAEIEKKLDYVIGKLDKLEEAKAKVIAR